MQIIGLTGGMGSGKSTIAGLFANLGVPIIDADDIAREILPAGAPVIAHIVHHFGSSIINPVTGELDRRLLRKKIFDSASDRKFLENLLHPIIYKNILKKIDELNKSGKKNIPAYGIIIIPLLIESLRDTRKYDFLNKIWVVDCPEEMQIERIKARDNIEEKEIKKILQAQCSRQERLAIADEIISNENNMHNLNFQVALLDKKYRNH